jgi:hypothetical protein
MSQYQQLHQQYTALPSPKVKWAITQILIFWQQILSSALLRSQLGQHSFMT